MTDLWAPTASSLQAAATRALAAGRDQGPTDDSTEIAEMRANRRISARLAGRMARTGARSGPDISFATGRPRDPFFYWKQNNLPYDLTKPEELKKIRAFCRALYLTNSTVAAAIDVFSSWPLNGMEVMCKDDAITDFYGDLFMEPDSLNYPKYLRRAGREYWLVGEAWPLGQFNEMLGVWEDDELINPDDVEVIRSPFLREPRFEIGLPDTIKEIIQKREPAWEYEALMRSYPELIRFVNDEKRRMPVSNVLLHQMRFDADTFHPRGLPILMRAFRALLQEEMLNSAQDSIADRLSTPLLLAKLGASATDLGTDHPWVPTLDDLSNLEEAIDAALAADFRVLVHHFALSLENAWGREVMPDFTPDFDRVMDRTLMAFGLSRTLLTGADRGETFAADAMNRDLITMLLTDYQDMQKALWKRRCLVVAEAQEHYDYREHGGRRYPVMEEIVEYDEETGEPRIVEVPKLLVPELRFRAMNMQDDESFRQLVEALRAQGVPISMKTRLINVPINLDEEAERSMDEQVQLAVYNQQVRKRTYEALTAEGLPIPAETGLKEDFEPKAIGSGENVRDKNLPVAQPMNGNGQPPVPGAGVIPTLGLEKPAPTTALAPQPGDLVNTDLGAEIGGTVMRLPQNRQMQRQRVPESDSMRSRQPTPPQAMTASLEGSDDVVYLVADEDDLPEGGLANGPAHVGMRRWAKLDPQKPLDEQIDLS